MAEAGGHRWQQVSGTGRKARVHTSTVTVSVLLDKQLAEPAGTRPDSEFSVTFFSGTGKGGQHRNRHANSVRMTHLPTGLTQTAVGRVKQANLEQARARLEELLEEREREAGHAKANLVRTRQAGSGQRGDKRRTYRLQEDTVRDGVTGKSTRVGSWQAGQIHTLW